MQAQSHWRSSIYKSYTHGPIPLSREARNLMQNLREAITAAIRAGEYTTMHGGVAFARGELAQYMSKLEGKNVEHTKPAPYRGSWTEFRERYINPDYTRKFSHGLALLPVRFLPAIDWPKPPRKRKAKRAKRAGGKK